MKKSLFLPVFLAASWLAISSAMSHPHMFLDTTAKFRIDGKQRLQSVVLNFVVDELNTALTIATLELDKDGDKVFSSEDRKKVASNVVDGFAYYKFFTYLLADEQKIPLKAPTSADIKFVNGKLEIGMEIFLEKPIVVSRKAFTLKLYDPSYFTEVTLAQAPKILGSASHCNVQFHKATPDENSKKLQVSLSQLSREETPEIENVGALFADKTRLVCAG